MLSADDILTEGNKPSHLPDHRGLKFFTRENSTKEQQGITVALEGYKQCLREERVCRKSNLSIGSWKKEDNMVLITNIKGSTVQKFGYQIRSGKFLHPEEALFLVEQGILELYNEEMPLSLQETYMILSSALPSFEYYQVFQYLCRQGFLVSRFKNSLIKEQQGEQKQEDEKLCYQQSHSNLESIEYTRKDVPECLKCGYMKSLWNGNDIPLLNPSKFTTTATVLSVLRQGKLISLSDYVDADGMENNSIFRIDFDVYASKQSKRKTKQNISKPQFRVVVCKYSDLMPSLKDVARLSKDSQDVDLKVGLVNEGTVTFYELFSVDLPTSVPLP